MLILRILGILIAILIGSGILAYLFTSDTRYLRISARIARYALIALSIILILYFLAQNLSV